MKLSYSWLCDHVDLAGLTPEEVADQLTMGAFEVEEIARTGPDLTGPVIVGQIMEITTHPNADKIRLTKVKVDENKEPLEIVCGAQNIEVGQRIPVALPGAIVLNRKTGEKLPIIASAIRGVHSNGMLCSSSELGIANGDTDGILILSKPGENGIALGTDVIEKLALKPEFVFHVAPRSNRGDALSVIGLARELAAILNRPMKVADWKLSAGEAEKAFENRTDGGFSTSIESLDDCAYFSIRLIDGVKIGPSPSWLQTRLESVGMRTVNNVVDITNYVMLEYGQPLHAYDREKVDGETIAVRRAKKGENLTSLDGKVRELSEEILAITDKKNIIGLAGIMGGKDSEISDETTRIALEAAAFTAQRVRRGGRLVGLSSDSSLRFERGVDAANVKRASDRATYLIQKYCGPDVKVKEFVYCGSDQVKVQTVSMRLSQVKRLLNVVIDKATALKYLSSLGFEKDGDNGPDTVTVRVPSFRQQDVYREIDLIEEVCRLYGYNNLPEEMPSASITPTRPAKLISDIRSSLFAQGLSEAWLSSLVGTTEGDESKSIKVLNPLSKDHQVLRNSLIPGLVDAVKYNQDRGNKDVWMFETGRAYEKALEKDKDRWGTGVCEKSLVAGVISGSLVSQINKSERVKDKIVGQASLEERVDFYRIKGIVENLLGSAGIAIGRLRVYRPKAASAFMHPYRVANVAVAPADKFPHDVEGKHEERVVTIGYIGELNPGYLNRKDIKEPVFGFELDVDKLKELWSAKTSFVEPAATPAVTRDLTVDLDTTIDHAAVKTVLEATAGARLIDTELVSIYPLEEGKQSLSYRLTFQDREKTLTSDEIDQILKKVREALVSRLKAQFRA